MAVRRRLIDDDAGVTMIELIVVMSIVGVLVSLASFGFWNWRQTSEHQGSAQQFVSQLRNVAVRAVSEGRTYCVDIDASKQSYSLWRYACDGSTGTQAGGPWATQSNRISLAAAVVAPTPAPSCPSSHSCLYFYPRGTAIPATVTVSSSSRANTYTVHVEGLTARVWM